MQCFSTWVLEADSLGSNSDMTSYSCVMLSKLLKFFCASISSTVKGEYQQYLPLKVQGLNEIYVYSG